jgi:hypothetical protein
MPSSRSASRGDEGSSRTDFVCGRRDEELLGLYHVEAYEDLVHGGY